MTAHVYSSSASCMSNLSVRLLTQSDRRRQSHRDNSVTVSPSTTAGKDRSNTSNRRTIPSGTTCQWRQQYVIGSRDLGHAHRREWQSCITQRATVFRSPYHDVYVCECVGAYIHTYIEYLYRAYYPNSKSLYALRSLNKKNMTISVGRTEQHVISFGELAAVD